MQKKWSSAISTYLVLIICMMFVAACAMLTTNLMDRAKLAASASYSVYNSITPQVVDEIEAIVEKERAGTITDKDIERLRTLNELKNLLEKYAQTHNLFVKSLKAWEATQQEPQDNQMLNNQLLRLINMALDVAKELNLKVPEHLR